MKNKEQLSETAQMRFDKATSFLKLVQAAQKGGWVDGDDLERVFKTYLDWEDYKYHDAFTLRYIYDETYDQRLSINDLILNWGHNWTSFIDGLINASNIKDIVNTHSTYYRTLWIGQPTSQRLDWLFNEFKHLINEE